MCCFSRSVESVSHTQIFARSAAGDRQYLVYHMRLRAKDELAMILPIPVPKASQEDAVRFISLKDYPRFFNDLYRGFRGRSAAAPQAAAVPKEKALAVVEVGDFEASFVPTVADFKRLDERFRLPGDTWNQLPAYKDFGFAVFKLKPGGTDHPMAFEFPRERPDTLFFPTVHIHDGKVHGTAEFDHLLFCQAGEGEFGDIMRWRESNQQANSFMDVEKCAGIVDGEGHCYLKEVHGRRKNEDVVLT